MHPTFFTRDAMLITTEPDVHTKLSLLSQASQYDLACACKGKGEPGRTRSTDNQWIYPVMLPDGGRTFLFKTLLSSACVNDCGYCPLRAEKDSRRCGISPEEIVNVFMGYLRAGRVSGLFLSSGVVGSADATMERLNRAARLLRQREKFKGYVHLKVIPGASDAAVEEAVSLASAVSINIEAPGEAHFSKLSRRKNYNRDVIGPLKLISRLTEKGGRFQKVKQTTQFVVGASTETDADLIRYSGALYDRMHLNRIYFSAYQRGEGRPDLPGETACSDGGTLLTREHRLYQADFLMRRYGFGAEEIPLSASGFLSLEQDPKEIWARLNSALFPVNINRADKKTLLRVPGFGPITVNRLLKIRRNGGFVNRLEQLGHGRVDKRLSKALEFIRFG